MDSKGDGLAQLRIKIGGLLTKHGLHLLEGNSSRRNACYWLCIIYFWATVFIFTTLQAELLWELQQDLDVAGGLLHCLRRSGQMLLQSSVCKSLLLLSRQSLPVEGLTVEMTALYVATGEEAGTAVWEHTRNQKQEQHEPHGVRNSLIVSSGDEQRTRTLATATWRNSIFQGATSLLGLGLVTPKALETQAAKGA